MADLVEILRQHAAFAPVIKTSRPFRVLDFTEANSDLTSRDLSETAVFSEYIFDEVLEKGRYTGVGGYGEDRVIYRQRAHFVKNAAEPRSIHLGVDIWVPAGEPVYAPYEGQVHSFAFNDQYGDYGPTIILSHILGGVRFYTLYGHLSLGSLQGLIEGKYVTAGEKIGYVGKYPENGDWPPHLHFQIIAEIGHYKGDFPGVSSYSDKAHYLLVCPNPNLILGLHEIK